MAVPRSPALAAPPAGGSCTALLEADGSGHPVHF